MKRTIPRPIFGQIISFSSLNIRDDTTLPILRPRLKQVLDKMPRNDHTTLKVAHFNKFRVARRLVYFLVLLQSTPRGLREICRTHVDEIGQSVRVSRVVG